MRTFLLGVALIWAGSVLADGYYEAPYTYFPFVADSTDVPPVNYEKVCEPGRTTESEASYIILGITFPRAYPAVNADYTGDLVVPTYIDGLPVRKIKASAFLACTGLTSVTIPATVREIDDRAFSDCYALTNVTFSEGLCRVGAGAFSNCTSLASVRFPESLAILGSRCFQGCVSLKDVYFEGNAPVVEGASVAGRLSPLGESLFRNYGYYERTRIHVRTGTTGWIAPYAKGVPEKWPAYCGFQQAHEVVAEAATSTTNAPSGFVTVITEVVSGGAVSVPESWSLQFTSYTARFGSDFSASLGKSTGKTDAAGKAMYVWQDYVAGTDPTDPESTFTAFITFEDNEPVITYKPVLSAAETMARKYTVWGKAKLTDTAWTEVPTGSAGNYNFFKMTVELK